MLYEELMLDSSLLLRFKIFHYLNQSSMQIFPVNQLSDVMDLNYQQTVIELNEIDQELKDIHPEHESIMMRAGKINLDNLSATVDEYRYHLLKQSVPFQFILYFLNEEIPTIKAFCDEYFVSRSTISRKINRLKRYLKTFNLRFTYTEAGMSGDERLIRIALFDILWLGTRGLDYPLEVNQQLVDQSVETFQSYFPLSRTYFGVRELRLFAGISLLRLNKQHFTKYDSRYNFLMKDNPYYDFTSLGKIIDVPLTTRQLKGETSFIYFLAHYAPFYTVRDDSSLKQTIHDFDTRPNPVNAFVTEFRRFGKKALFPDKPEILDDPLIIGNLLNITFAYYIFRQPFPNIMSMVFKPSQNQSYGEHVIEQNIMNFMQIVGENPDYQFIRPVGVLLGKSFKHLLMPSFNQFPYAQNLRLGIAMEHNAMFVQELYHFLEDLRFVQAEPYDASLKEDYDLIISSSMLLRSEKTKLPIYVLDHNYKEKDLIPLYTKLREIYGQKNRANAKS
ncbi:helix-turn-helix domain-containing protein [Enterococcus sp. AZ072]|uniref:helix-turn-helix domain-containing protein n=1 Tax=unclassified Enterococcus TaxID=2608891 RepID=UPI003D2915EB